MNTLIVAGLGLVHTELSFGAPGDVAVKNAVAALESKIANPLVKSILTAVLNAAVTASEQIAAALPAV